MELLQMIALFMPIFIGAGWWMLMYHHDYDVSRSAAMWFALACILMGVLGQSISIVADNLPMWIALLLLALYNLYQFPTLTDSEKHQLSLTNAGLSYALIGYQVWFQYGNIWRPYLAGENLTLTVMLVLYIISGGFLFLFSLIRVLKTISPALIR